MTKITHSRLQHPHTINLTNYGWQKQRKTMLPLKIEHVPTQPNGDVFIMGLTFSGKLWLCMKWSEAEQHFSLTWRCFWVCLVEEKKPECVSDEHICDRWMSWLTQASAPDCHHSCSWWWLRSESWRLLGCLNLVWIISSSKSLVGRETVRYSKVWDNKSDLSPW